MLSARRRTTRSCLAAAFFLALAGTAGATTVTGYDKSVAYPLSEVTIQGSSFPSRSGVSVVYGSGNATNGSITSIQKWSGTSIRVTLPANMPAGTFWLGLYRGSARLAKGPNLNVRPMAVQHAPATKSKAASAPAVQHASPPSVQHQPLPPERPEAQGGGLPTGRVVLQESSAEHRIAALDILQASDPGLVTPGSVVETRVGVRNLSRDVGARFRLGYRTLQNKRYRPEGSREFQYVGPKQTVYLQVPIHVDPANVRNGEFRTTLWLADTDYQPRRQSHRDDARYEIVWRASKPTYRVVARLQDLRVLHHCDGGDDYGEWRVKLTLSIDGESTPRSSSVWPGSDDYADVSVGRSLDTGLWAELKGVPADKTISVGIRVEDDDDVSTDIAQGWAKLLPARWVGGTTQEVVNRPENAMGCDNEREIFAGNVAFTANLDDGNRVTIPVSQSR